MAPDSDSSRSVRDSLALRVTVNVDSATTNESFAYDVCRQIDDTARSFTVALYDASRYFVLPECFFSAATNLQLMTVANVIISGNTDIPDPLTRLPTSLKSLTATTVRFTSPTLITSVNAQGQLPYAPNWDSFSASHPNVESLLVTSSGISSFPTSLPPKLISLSLPSNLLTGSIPTKLLSTLNPSFTTSLTLVLTDNRITGSIPPSLFSSMLPDDQKLDLTNLVVQLLYNRISGSLPSKLFENLTVSGSFDFNANGNSIGGSIPANFFGPGAFTSAGSFAFSMARNRLIGSIPADLVTSSNAASSSIRIDLSSNKLSSNIPSTLLSFATEPIIPALEIYLTGNELTGTIPNLFEGALTWAGLDAWTFDASYNKLTGHLPVRFFRPNSNIGLNNNRLSGSLPSTLMSTTLFTNFRLTIDNNDFDGSPFDCLRDMTSSPNITGFFLSAVNNSFTGALPAQLFSALCHDTVYSFMATLDFSGNQLSGEIPSGVFGNCNSSEVIELELRLLRNQISGAIPPNLFSPVTSLAGFSSITLNMSHNEVHGPLPPTLFPSTELPVSLAKIALDFSNNHISTPLTDGLLSGASSALRSLDIRFDNNPLSGTIPTAFFDLPSYVELDLFAAYLRNCSLGGVITAPLLNGTVAVSGLMLLDDNLLEGDFHAPSLIVPPDSAVGQMRIFQLSMPRNKLSAFIDLSLIYPSRGGPPPLRLYLNLAGNRFSTLLLDDKFSMFTEYLDISSNPSLNGSLPNLLLSPTSSLVTLLASHTPLTGKMPNLGALVAPYLNRLDLSDTRIDFCSPAGRSVLGPIASLAYCSLLNTNAASSCKALYPLICFNQVCNIASRPSPQFVCIGGVWTSTEPVDTPTLVIPGGGTATVIEGSVTSTTITFTGIGTTLFIRGCANNLTTITVELTPSELESLGSEYLQTLLSYDGNATNCNDLNSINVSSKVTGSSCRKVSVQKSVSSGQLSGLFTVDASRCNTWWIILVSVLCGVIVLLIVVVVLLVLFVPSVRNCIRPFSRKRTESPTLK